MHKNKRFLISDLEKYGKQTSVDIEADIRFAHFIEDFKSEELLKKLAEEGRWSCTTYITSRRLRTLQGLIHMGLVKARWVGTGCKGRSTIGACRIKVYRLSTSVESEPNISNKDEVKSTRIGYESSITRRKL